MAQLNGLYNEEKFLFQRIWSQNLMRIRCHLSAALKPLTLISATRFFQGIASDDGSERSSTNQTHYNLQLQP
jgi:hypothetical protein